MLSFKNTILFFILFNVVGHVRSLVELPTVEDNDIGITETIIRTTVNNLFTSFKMKDVKTKAKLKEIAIIHNFFVSITLKDCDNLKEIARLTRVKNIDNNTQHFITQINEVLNEGDKNNEDADDIYVTTYIEAFIRKLRYLKNTFGENNLKNLSINPDVLKHLNDKERGFNNVTNVETHTNVTVDKVFDDDEIWQPSGRRVFRGHRTRIRFFPFMASVQFFERFQCAGSIIRKDLVITAASCLQLAWNNRFFRENPAFLSVQIGCDYYMNGGENIAVLEVHFHPDYEPKYLRNNIAVLRLSTHIIFSQKLGKVKRIDLDDKASPLPVNTDGIIILGWGSRSANNIVYNPWYNRLAYAELDYYPMQECKEIYSSEYVSEKNFCAGFLSKGGGACNHDVGGPGISGGVLVGVISFGPPVCGTVDAPTVFTKVGYYRRWIDNIMKENVPEIVRLSTKLRRKTSFALHYSDTTREYFKVTPIIRHTRKTTPHEETTAAPVTGNIRILQDDKLFNEFMATMFESSEAKKYFKPVGQDVTKDDKKLNLKHRNVHKTKHTSNRISSSEVESDVTSKEVEFKLKPMKTIKHADSYNVDKSLDNNDDIEKFLDDLDAYKLLDTDEIEKIDDELNGRLVRAREDESENNVKSNGEEVIDFDETSVEDDSQLYETRANLNNLSAEIEAEINNEFDKYMAMEDKVKIKDKSRERKISPKKKLDAVSYEDDYYPSVEEYSDLDQITVKKHELKEKVENRLDTISSGEIYQSGASNYDLDEISVNQNKLDEISYEQDNQSVDESHDFHEIRLKKNKSSRGEAKLKNDKTLDKKKYQSKNNRLHAHNRITKNNIGTVHRNVGQRKTKKKHKLVQVSKNIMEYSESLEPILRKKSDLNKLQRIKMKTSTNRKLTTAKIHEASVKIRNKKYKKSSKHKPRRKTVRKHRIKKSKVSSTVKNTMKPIGSDSSSENKGGLSIAIK